MSIRTILLAAASVVCMAALGQKSITAQECWLDGNFAARQPATATVDLSGLPVGLHSYSIRVQDSEGMWSSAVTKYFVIPSSIQPATNITACEYWIDSDMSTRATIGASPAQIDITDLTIGLHTFTIRTQDNNGVWSSPITKYFIKEKVVEPTTIARYMYWIDDDVANRVVGELTATGGTLPVTLPGTLADGTHTLSWCVGDSKGVWSNVRTETFNYIDLYVLQQDEDGYYLLGSVRDWQEFAELVKTTPTANAKMTADINLGDDQTMVGTDAVPYAGIFDGQGHTLTVNYNIYSVETAVAPFACVNGATILNLHVAGSIRQRRCAAGGVVGSVNGNLTVKKCWVSATLTVDGEGNYQGTIGGIASCCDNSSVQGKSILLEDCLFSGYVATGIHCGGLMSHVHGESYNNSAAFNNCLNIGTCNGPSGSTGTFIRTGVQGDPYTITNCYYKTAWRVAQGAQATETELADGTTTAALQNSREEEIWVQEGEMPMLKIFASEITPVEPTVWENGVLPGKFTINANGDQIAFSQGNLQYQATTDTWRFALYQYDMIGGDNTYISDSYDGWIDLIQWGAGNNPTTIATYTYNTFVEFGSHPISNGGNTPDAWRTMTKDEWVYLFYGRTNAESLFGLGAVNGVNGVIILPDNWTTPDDLTFNPSTEHGLAWQTSTGYYKSSTADGFSHNVYTLEQWATMESNGAVFLPAAGIRYIGTKSIQQLGTGGYYWSSVNSSSTHAYVAGFGADILNPQHSGMQDYGHSIRLVHAAQEETPTGVESIQPSEGSNLIQKILRNGQLLILRGDKIYNVVGTVVR